MGALKLSSDLRPLSDLKSGAAEVVRQVTETGRPVVLTRHGRGVAVVLSIESYEQMEAQAELPAIREALRAAEGDVAAGRISKHLDVAARMRARHRSSDLGLPPRRLGPGVRAAPPPCAHVVT